MTFFQRVCRNLIPERCDFQSTYRKRLTCAQSLFFKVGKWRRRHYVFQVPLKKSIQTKAKGFFCTFFKLFCDLPNGLTPMWILPAFYTVCGIITASTRSQGLNGGFHQTNGATELEWVRISATPEDSYPLKRNRITKSEFFP